MKTIFFSLSLTLFLLASCGGPTQTPVEYNDGIVAEQTKIVGFIADFSTSLQAQDRNKTEKARLKVIEESKKSVKALKAMKDYEGNTALRDACIKLIEFYGDVCSNEYKEIVELQAKGIDITEEDLERATEIDTKVIAQEESLMNDFKAVQKVFADKHNFILMPNFSDIK